MDYYSKKSIWKWVLVYVLIGVVVYGLVYYFVFYKKDDGNYQYSKPTGEQTISNSQNETADWKTYKNDEYGFEVKYPPEGSITQIREDVLGNKAESPNQCVKISYNNVFVYASLPPYNIICGGTTGLGIDSIKLEEQVRIDGKTYQAKGWKLGQNDEFLSFKIENLHITYGVTGELGNNTYHAYKNLIYQMLSTFKFTISAQQAISLVKNRQEVKNWLYLFNQPNGTSSIGGVPIIEIDHQDDKNFVVHVYEVVRNEHTATFNWYDVDKETGSVKPQFEK